MSNDLVESRDAQAAGNEAVAQDFDISRNEIVGVGGAKPSTCDKPVGRSSRTAVMGQAGGQRIKRRQRATEPDIFPAPHITSVAQSGETATLREILDRLSEDAVGDDGCGDEEADCGDPRGELAPAALVKLELTPCGGREKE